MRADRDVPAEELFEATLALARQVAGSSPAGVRVPERCIQRHQRTSCAAALELEDRGQALVTRTRDVPGVLAAMREEREPRSTGR